MLRGVDISNHQGRIDWDAVAGSGQSFAFMKASEDPDYLDAWLARNWRESRRVGLVRGCYHYARPERSSPAESVTLFERAILAAGGLDVGDLVVLDIEAGDGNLSQWVGEWLDLAEKTFGVRPIIYSGAWFMEPHGLSIPAFGRYPLWLASYQATVPPVPAGWSKLSFWQSSDRGSVPGVVGHCDLDTFFGTRDELRALGKAAPAANLATFEREIWSPVWAAKDAAWRLGRKELGDALEKAILEDKRRAGAQ